MAQLVGLAPAGKVTASKVTAEAADSVDVQFLEERERGLCAVVDSAVAQLAWFPDGMGVGPSAPREARRCSADVDRAVRHLAVEQIASDLDPPRTPRRRCGARSI